MVPGGGFEPPTRGFSIRCSTPELPGHWYTKLRVYDKGATGCPVQDLAGYSVCPRSCPVGCGTAVRIISRKVYNAIFERNMQRRNAAGSQFSLLSGPSSSGLPGTA